MSYEHSMTVCDNMIDLSINDRTCLMNYNLLL